MPGFISPWREAVSSPRLMLPTVDASGHARGCSAGRPRLLLHAAWGASVLLVGLLLFSQVQIIPRGISRHAIVPIDELTRLLPMSLMRPASSAQSAPSRDGSSASHIAAAELESLWSMLDFTPAVQVEPTGSDDQTDLAQAPHSPPEAAGSPLQQASSSSIAAAWPAQPLLAPLEPPALAHPSQHDIQLMAGIVKETIRARITAAEARAGFISAFEGIVPPPGIHRWQVKPPHDQLQGWQHMGAEQLQADAGASAAGADGNNNDDSAAADQQAAGYDESAVDASDEYAATTPANDGADASGASSRDPAAAPATSEQQRGQLAQSAAEHLMTYALLLLKGSKRIEPCGSDDDSLPLPLSEVPGGPPGGRLLLAAALNGDEEEALPNLVLQLLLFAVQASPGSLFISIYESGGSTGATSYWLDVLRLLLVPLRVPAHIVTGGSLTQRPGQSRVEFIASVRNAAIEPFFNTTAAAAAGCPLGDQPQQPASISSSNGQASLAQQQQQQSITTSNAQPGSVGQQAGQLPQPEPASWQQRMLLQLQQRSARQQPAAAAPVFSNQARPGRRLAYSFSLTAPFWLPDVFGASANATPAAPAATPAPTAALTEQLMVPAGAPASNPGPAVVQQAVPIQAVVSSSTVPGPSQPACYQPDHVMFLDGSIFFCKSDLQRMLLHRHADMACGWSLHMPSSSSADAANSTASNGNTSSSSSAELFNVSSAALPAEIINTGAQQGLAATANPSTQAAGVFPPPFPARRQLLQESPLTSEQFLQQQQLLQRQQHELLQQQQQLLKQQQLLQQQQELFKQQQLLQQQQQLIKQQQEENQELLAQVLGNVAGGPGSIQERLTQLVQSAAALQSSGQPSNLAGPATSSGGNAASTQLPPVPGDAPWSGQQQQQPEQPQDEQQLPEEAYEEEEGLDDELQLPAVLERPSATELSHFPFGYSDAAVGRMVNGQLFDVAPYYAASHPPTVRRLTAGLPFQVYCCWSGLVKLRAEPFRRGLRFRGHQPGECGGRDTSLLCDDLHRLNFSRVLIDSGVLVSRQLELAKKLSTNVRQAKRMPYIRRSRWIEVQGGGSPWVMSAQQLRRTTYANVTCCDEQEQSPALTQQLDASGGGHAHSSRRLSADMSMHTWLAAATLPVDQQQASLLGSWGGQCRRLNVMARNFTRDFLQGVQQI